MMQSNSHLPLVIVASLIYVAGFSLVPQIADAPMHRESVVVSSMPAVSIGARAGYLLDVETGEVLFAQNPELQLPLASITKVVTAMVASEILSATSTVMISAENIKEEGDSGLLAGEQWMFNDLTEATLVASLNDGAAALAETAGTVLLSRDENHSVVTPRQRFVSEMNRRVREWGLYRTYFLNESGLDESLEVAGAYGTVGDVARLVAIAIKKNPDIFGVTRYDSLRAESLAHRQLSLRNTNSHIAFLSGALGSKTGSTNLAGGNLAVAFDVGIGRPLVAVVLGGTPDGRFADIDTLASQARDFFLTRQYRK